MAKNKIVSLISGSTADLAHKLQTLDKKVKSKSRYVSIAISDKRVMTCPFDLPRVSLKKLKDRLALEAVELLSLPADQIVLDYQILESTKEGFKGIYCASPRDLICKYLDVIKQEKFIPVNVTLDMLKRIDSFFSAKTDIKERFCLLVFAKDSNIYLAIFDGLRLELMRKVQYESLDEAKEEITKSLRSACAKSVKKDIDKIYIAGEVLSDESLMTDLKNNFSTECQRIDDVISENKMKRKGNFFKINLIRREVYSIGQRRAISFVLSLILLTGLIGSFFLAGQIKNNQEMIDTLSIPTAEKGFEIV